jgi:hypothetical protein
MGHARLSSCVYTASALHFEVACSTRLRPFRSPGYYTTPLDLYTFLKDNFLGDKHTQVVPFS